MPTLQLWVSALGAERTGWTRVGTSPYLNAQDQPTNYVYSIVKKADIGDFDYQDTAETGTINSVTLYIYGQTAVAGNIFYIWDGATWTAYTPVLPATWGWASIAVPVLDTWVKINGAKMYIYHPNSTARTDIDAVYLFVDYTVGVTEKSFVDSGSGSDAFLNPFRAMGFSDSGGGSDGFVNPYRAMGFSDVGSGTDAFAVLLFKAFSDAGLGTDGFTKEQIIGAIEKAFSDSGLGSDVFTKLEFFGKAFSDSCSGTDSFGHNVVAKGVAYGDKASWTWFQGSTGTFTTADGKTVTVKDGLIISIV